MNKDERLQLIESRLIAKFSPDFLRVVDESEAHLGHAGYQGGGRHFAITIQAAALSNLSRIQAHREIYALFVDFIPEYIHALKIKIVKN